MRGQSKWKSIKLLKGGGGGAKRGIKLERWVEIEIKKKEGKNYKKGREEL